MRIPLSFPQLQEIRRTLAERISQGMASEGQQVACLPAFLAPPHPSLRGRALVVDAGGTNVRAALVDILGEARSQVLAGPLSGTLPDGRQAPTTCEVFFAYQAELLHQLQADLDLPLGYCFSYPAQVEPDGDARLLRWTKGIRVTGVEGQRVGEALLRAARLRGPVKVLNDTVACLLGGAYWAGSEAERSVGLIVGTGTNMAAFFPAESYPRFQGSRTGPMAVNLESGNFHPPHLSELDEELDRASDNPGRQRYEKAVSGFYLPQLLARLHPELAAPAEATSEWVVECSGREGQAGESARWILNRSADLVAAGLAGVADRLAVDSLVVQAEGGLFWKAPGYAARVEEKLSSLLRSGNCRIVRGDEVNLVGAAVAALQGS